MKSERERLLERVAFLETAIRKHRSDVYGPWHDRSDSSVCESDRILWATVINKPREDKR